MEVFENTMQLWLAKFTLLLLCVTGLMEDLRHSLETPTSGPSEGRKMIQAKQSRHKSESSQGAELRTKWEKGQAGG